MTERFDAGRMRIRLPGWAYALARLYSETGRTDNPK